MKQMAQPRRPAQANKQAGRWLYNGGRQTRAPTYEQPGMALDEQARVAAWDGLLQLNDALRNFSERHVRHLCVRQRQNV